MLKLMQLNIQLFAHKKGQGSTKNGRDSISKRLGAKASDGEYVTGGSILYRQRGTKVYPGVNVGIGSDDTVYAKIEYKGRKEVEMIDKAALKEAVINAVVHNDYSYGNSPIIELYSDRIEITSAGGLPQELSQEEFLEGVTAPRNKELIRVFKDVDLIENIGSGY